MGLSFHKSIKIGKNTRLNFSKTGGIGISTGVKGARVSVNQKGIRTTVGKGGLQYRKDVSFKNINNSRSNAVKTVNTNKKYNNEEKELRRAILRSPELTEFNRQSYTTHMKLLFAGIVLLLVGMIVPPLLLISVGLLIGGLVCAIVNWKRINKESRDRKLIEAEIREKLIENNDF